MMRVIYEFEVDAARTAEFERGWAIITRNYRENIEGALGSVLMRDPENESRYIAVARWRSRAHWERDHPDAAFDAGARTQMRASGTCVRTMVLEEVEDLVVQGDPGGAS